MTDRDEKLACLLDDFAAENPSAAIDEVIADVNLQYQARRYRMIGEAMRNELPDVVDTGLHATVMARIRAEAPQAAVSRGQADPVATALPAEPLFGWFTRPLAGLAVAATVAVVTVALWTQGETDNTANADVASAETQKVEKLAGQSTAGAPVSVSVQVKPAGMRWKIDNDAPELQQKLNAYLVNHTEYSNSVQGLIPQARVAGFDAQQ